MATATKDRTNGHVWHAPIPLPATLDLSAVTAEGATAATTEVATAGATMQVNATVTPQQERNSGAEKAATVTATEVATAGATQTATKAATKAATDTEGATRNTAAEAPAPAAATVTPPSNAATNRTEKSATAGAVAPRDADQKPSRSGRAVGWLRRGLDALQANGVKVGYVMALAGSAVGQIAWWGSLFPVYIAAVFCFTYEAIMVGASKKATLRRMQGRSATALRLVSLGAAAAATWMNYTHMGSPDTVIQAFGVELRGSSELGLAFALMSAGGFLVHELATNADVNDRLRDTGQLKPIGLSRWIFHTRHALRTKLLLLDRPDLTLAQAWELTREGDATDKLHTEALKAEKAAEKANAAATTQEIPVVTDEPVKNAPAKPKAKAAAKPKRSSAEVLTWVQSELSAGRTPSRAEIKERFGMESASLRTYLSRWKSSGQITEAQYEAIK